MSTEEIDPKLPQPFRVHRSSSAADERKVRSIGACIFAELFSRSTKSLAPVRPSPHPQPSLSRLGGLQPDGASLPLDPPVQDPHPSVTRARKETFPVKAYRTESPYYFSSLQLLPVGSLVFFSNKLHRYVHPTDGILLDPHPRLQLLSDAESQELEEHWRNALSRY